MKPAALALLLATALAACSRTPVPQPPPEDVTPERIACRAEARNSPEVRVFDRQNNINNTWNQLRINEDRRIATERAFTACLHRKGLTPPGGVEPERFR